MSDPVIDRAVQEAREGRLHQALVILKTEKGMNLQDARALVAERLEAERNIGGTTTSEQERALQEAFDTAETFDEITADMLRYCKEERLPIATQPVLTASEIRTVAANIRKMYLFLIEHNVNPTRAMRAILTRDVNAVDDAVSNQLINDLTSLL